MRSVSFRFDRARSIEPPRFTSIAAIFSVIAGVISAPGVGSADNSYQSLPFAQDWSNTGMITLNDDWSAVPGIIGYLGDSDPLNTTNVDPRTLTSDIPVSVDVIANQVSPNVLINGGVAEFDVLANPVVALQGSGTADAPYLVLHLNTFGSSNILLSYVLRDIDGSPDNAAQRANAQYRISSSGPWTNLDNTYFADVTQGPSQSGRGYVVRTLLPPAAENQFIQVRIMTTNAVGNDEWIGVDDISVRVQPTTTVDYSIVGCQLKSLTADSITFRLSFKLHTTPDPLPGEMEVPVRVLFDEVLYEPLDHKWHRKVDPNRPMLECFGAPPSCTDPVPPCQETIYTWDKSATPIIEPWDCLPGLPPADPTKCVCVDLTGVPVDHDKTMPRPTHSGSFHFFIDPEDVWPEIDEANNECFYFYDANYQSLPFAQDWSNTGMITVNDNWSGVPGIIGYLGDSDPLNTINVDPRTLTADVPVSVDVIANQGAPNALINGGVAEFDGVGNPVVALQGSGTADAPYLVLHLNTFGSSNILLSYVLRDIDGSADNAAQQSNAQYRIGSAGPWTNLDGTYFADVTQGPSQSGRGYVVRTLLPPAAENQLIQVRIMTTNALGNDEWIGIDDISVRTQPPATVDYSIVDCQLLSVTADSITFRLSLRLQTTPDPLPGEMEVPVRVLFDDVLYEPLDHKWHRRVDPNRPMLECFGAPPFCTDPIPPCQETIYIWDKSPTPIIEPWDCLPGLPPADPTKCVCVDLTGVPVDHDKTMPRPTHSGTFHFFIDPEDVWPEIDETNNECFHSFTLDVDPVGGESRSFVLHPVMPNPSSGASALRFGLAVPGRVHLGIYDVAGRLVRSLVDGVLDAGTHTATFDGKDQHGQVLAPGLYFARLRNADGTRMQRVLRTP